MHPTLGQRTAARPPTIRNIREKLPASQISPVSVILELPAG
jgi:hypothetical protein